MHYMLTSDLPLIRVIAAQCSSPLSAINTFFFSPAAVGKSNEPANIQ
jgi:hypothetical protein